MAKNKLNDAKAIASSANLRTICDPYHQERKVNMFPFRSGVNRPGMLAAAEDGLVTFPECYFDESGRMRGRAFYPLPRTSLIRKTAKRWIRNVRRSWINTSFPTFGCQRAPISKNPSIICPDKNVSIANFRRPTITARLSLREPFAPQRLPITNGIGGFGFGVPSRKGGLFY